jgi:hypothetical protein
MHIRMRRTLIAGLLLAAASFLTILVGEALDLDVEAVALLGATTGAIVALVPDETPARRLAAFALGLLAAVVGYFVRAAVLPDTASGRAVTAALVVLLCTGVAAAAMGRFPFWAVLLGAATWAGAYEYTFDAAPPRVVDTTMSTLTGLGLCVALGFLVVSFLAPDRAATVREQRQRDDATPLDDMMEVSR